MIGDCTGNWAPTSGAFRLAASSGATVHAGTVRARRWNTYQLPIYVQTATPFSALDVTLTYDPAVVTLRSVHPHGEASDALIGVHDDAGSLTVTLASATEIDGSNGAVLLVEFSADAEPADVAVDLLHAEVDDQPARLVNHADR